MNVSSRKSQFNAGARRANLRNGITGALICRGEIYVLWLEGPEEQAMNAISRIKRDDRQRTPQRSLTRGLASWSATWVQRARSIVGIAPSSKVKR